MTTSDALIAFCESLPHVTSDIKWGSDLVYSIGGKMFCCFDTDGGTIAGFKCSDEDFDRLTEIEGIIPAPYAARFGWVSVHAARALSRAELRRLIQASHDMVRAKLPARVRRELDDSSVDPGS